MLLHRTTSSSIVLRITLNMLEECGDAFTPYLREQNKTVWMVSA